MFVYKININQLIINYSYRKIRIKVSQFCLIVFVNNYLNELELGLNNTNFSYKYQKKSLKNFKNKRVSLVIIF